MELKKCSGNHFGDWKSLRLLLGLDWIVERLVALRMIESCLTGSSHDWKSVNMGIGGASTCTVE